ncbi:MAG: 6-phosphogluconolactonase [Bacteroidales bacterium]|nr:6-phosphogluconolactonase [Bacteroidales bacterium]
MDRQRNYIYPDKDSLVAAFVCEFQRFLGELSGVEKPVHISLSGGSTPLAVFRQLAGDTSPKDWSGVHLYWGDERCVPPEHQESNYGAAFKAMLEPLGLHRNQVHQIRGEEDPVIEAHRYGKLLMDQLPVEDGVPVFDWVWLGLGSDGHTASIFPHQIGLWKSEEPCVVATHRDTGQKRISITGGVINAARRVSFIVTGVEKSPVIKEILMKEGNFMDYPAFYVNPGSDNLEWYLDQDASNLL